MILTVLVVLVAVVLVIAYFIHSITKTEEPKVPTVLFFRSRTPAYPDHDLACKYGASWIGEGIAEATRRGYKVIDLYEGECTYDTLASVIASEKIDVAFMFGHGAPATFTGYNLNVVLQACQNDQIMSGTISHFLSCSVGQVLLPSMIGKTAISTIGYQVDFEFMVDTSSPVEQDPYAEPFKDVTVTIIKKILEGAPLIDVWQAGIDKCDEWIAKLWTKPETDWAEVISCLEHDRDGMIALGDKEAYVLPPKKVAAQAPVGFLSLIAAFLLTR
jgi:hypothetical protein